MRISDVLPQGSRQPQNVNVSDQERWITGAVGGLLVLAGLRRSLPGLLVTAAGGLLLQRAITGHCPAYETLGIDTAREFAGENEPSAEPHEYFDRGIHVDESFTINKSPQELYRYWRNFENLPRFMKHLESVKALDGKRSHWVACGPAGYRVEWDAEIINDEPNYVIAWRTVGSSDVDNAGSVRFVPAASGSGTDVKVVIDYIPPAGRIGDALSKLFGADPSQQIRDELRRFKELMESGEPAAANI